MNNQRRWTVEADAGSAYGRSKGMGAIMIAAGVMVACVLGAGWVSVRAGAEEQNRARIDMEYTTEAGALIEQARRLREEDPSMELLQEAAQEVENEIQDAYTPGRPRNPLFSSGASAAAARKAKAGVFLYPNCSLTKQM